MRRILLASLLLAAGPGCRPAVEPDKPAENATGSAPTGPSRGTFPSDRSRSPLESPRGSDLMLAMRELLRDRMARHGDDMARLQRVTLELEYELIAQSSAWLAEGSTIPRPAASDEELLRAGLPPRFFQLEAQMRGRAIELRGAALVRDDDGIAYSYGRLAETCILCHALYRRPSDREPQR